MPNRILYSTLLNSHKVNQLKPAEFELYVRLLLVADDFGRYSGLPVRIARSCWPDREDVTSKTIEPLLKRLESVGLVLLYSADGEKCLQITAWNQRTRQMSSKYPSPENESPSNDGQMTVNCQSDDCHMLTETETETETETYIGDGDVYSTEQTSCSMPIIELPLNDGSGYKVTEAMVNKWSVLYPAVDVMAELRKMVGWLDSNSKQRKTKSGIGRFVNGWLARQQDNPKPTRQSKAGRWAEFDTE